MPFTKTSGAGVTSPPFCGVRPPRVEPKQYCREGTKSIMESLGDILRRIAAGNSLKTTNEDRAGGDRAGGDRAGGDRAGLRSVEGLEPDEPAGPPCPLCDGAGWVSKRVPVGHPDFGEAFPCRCQQEAKSNQPVRGAAPLQQFGPTSPHYPGRHPPGRPLARRYGAPDVSGCPCRHH